MPDFCQISLPLQNPGDDKAEWVRFNGNRTYTVHPMTVKGADGKPTHRWAYGKIARLLIIWISTQVIRRKHSATDTVIPLPRTLKELMDELGIRRRPTGTDYKRFREQITAISTFHMTINDATPDRLSGHSFTLADSWNIGWTKVDHASTQDLYIKLTDETWKRMAHSVPLDASMVEILASTGKGQDLDIYAWLTQRIYALNHSSTFQTPFISWDSLSMQLGANYTRQDNFIARIRKSLDRIHMFWHFRYTIERGRGIRLYRSPMSVTPIPKKPATQGATTAFDKLDIPQTATKLDSGQRQIRSTSTWDDYNDDEEDEYIVELPPDAVSEPSLI